MKKLFICQLSENLVNSVKSEISEYYKDLEKSELDEILENFENFIKIVYKL